MNLTANEDTFITQTLAQYGIFHECSDRDLKKLFADEEFMLFAKDDIIINEGEEPKGVYLILSGLLKVCKKVSKNKKFIIKLVTKGDIIGIDCTVSGISCLKSVQVIEETKALFIPKNIFLKMIQDNVIFWMEIVKFIAEEIEFARTRIISFSQKNTKQRLAETILSLNKNIGSKNSGSDQIHLKPTDIASLIGTATGNLYKLLFSLEESGYIHYRYGKLTIHNIKGLDEIANAVGEEV